MAGSEMNYYNIKLPAKARYFKEDTFLRILSVPSNKPEIGRIVRNVVWPELVGCRFITTQVGRSYEGQRLSGLLLVSTIKLRITITYSTTTEDETVYAADFESYKTISVVLPEKLEGRCVRTMVETQTAHVMPYVEALHIKNISARTVEQCGLLLLDVNFPLPHSDDQC